MFGMNWKIPCSLNTKLVLLFYIQTVEIMDVETFAIDITHHCPQGSIVAKEWQKDEIELWELKPRL